MDFVLRTGDQANFDPTFGPAMVTAPPGVITGSGPGKIDGAIVCVEGDEASVVVPGATYVLPGHSPGTGTLTISNLGSDQVAQKGSCFQSPVLLRGSTFQARFQVMGPAVSGGGTPDPTPMYSGTGKFITATTKVQAE